MVFRSEAVLDPVGEDKAVLQAAGIALVCDLRSQGERARSPNRWWREIGTDVLDLDVLGSLPSGASPWDILRSRPSEDGAREAMRAVYEAFPAAAAAHLPLLFRRIAAGALPLLIHCTAGKDRTGFVVAVLLDALGVAREDVVADYLASRGRRTARVAEATRAMIVARTDAAIPDAVLDILLGVEKEYLDASFAVIEREYGGIDGYLAAIGLAPAEVVAVRERLLD